MTNKTYTKRYIEKTVYNPYRDGFQEILITKEEYKCMREYLSWRKHEQTKRRVK